MAKNSSVQLLCKYSKQKQWETQLKRANLKTIRHKGRNNKHMSNHFWSAEQFFDEM